MSELHASLHNELNYLGAIDGLLKNHVVIGDQMVGFGAQIGFDLVKGFPLITSAGLRLQDVIVDGVALSKDFAEEIETLVHKSGGGEDSVGIFITDCPSPVNSMHILIRGGQFDLNVQFSLVEVLHEMPKVIGSFGVLINVLGRLLSKAPGFLSMQFAGVYIQSSDEGIARLRLEDQITVPDRVAIKPFESLEQLTPEHVVHSNLIIKAAA